jgi:hypothetical protein
VKLTFVPTLADFRASLRLHCRQKMSRYIYSLLSLWLLPFLILLFLLSSIYTMATDRENYTGGAGWIVLAFLFALAIPLRRTYAVRRQYKLMFPPSQTSWEVLIDIDEDRVISSLPGSSEGKFFWNSILDFAQNEKVTLLYVRKNVFLFFPTQAMSPAQRTELNDLVARNMVRRK